MGRPSKGFRGRLLRLAVQVATTSPGAAAPAEEQIESACAAVELLHAGSLIIDDIQDGSPCRRGGASLHLAHGLPRALCTGNWLYFWPMRLLRGLGLAPAAEAAALRHYQEAVERAHYGQALDLSTRVDAVPRHELAPLCDTILELKTGSITGLAMALGALVAGADPAATAALAAFGRRFGKTLQYFDDVGNLTGRLDPGKRCEDLAQRKPTGVWALAAGLKGDATGALLAAAAALPEVAAVDRWLTEHEFVPRAEARLLRDMETALSDLAEAFSLSVTGPELRPLRDLGKVLTDAY
jgi:geranylgeranyl pyrophosphate synthase